MKQIQRYQYLDLCSSIYLKMKSLLSCRNKRYSFFWNNDYVIGPAEGAPMVFFLWQQRTVTVLHGKKSFSPKLFHKFCLTSVKSAAETTSQLKLVWCIGPPQRRYTAAIGQDGVSLAPFTATCEWIRHQTHMRHWYSLRTTLYSMDPASWGPESIILSMAFFSAGEQICRDAHQNTQC